MWQLGLGTAAGIALWFATLALTRHALLGEITALLRSVMDAVVRPRPAPAPR